MRRVVPLVVGVGVACAASAQTFEAMAEWSTGPAPSGHTYMLYSHSEGLTWAEAQAHAESMGGTLATIGSLEENEFVYNALQIAANPRVWHTDSFNSRIGPWLGGLQAPGSNEPAGGWQWVTGEPWGFAKWAHNEPNNLGGTENRVHFFGNPVATSNWNDITDTVPIEGWVVELVEGPCNDADLAPLFGVLDLGDINAFVTAFVAQVPPADLNGDTIFDLRDITLFIDAFVGGCP
jgi:hypothetical protein